MAEHLPIKIRCDVDVRVRHVASGNAMAGDQPAQSLEPHQSDAQAANEICFALMRRFGWMPLNTRYGIARAAIDAARMYQLEHPESVDAADAKRYVGDDEL